ncbi:MAG TPA: hypothetical protein VF740_07005 [Candidatus Acidoferrum sp.]
MQVPNVRWPGGCFADEYHWRKGIGAQRAVTLNPNWGGVLEANTFGTHEFMDFLEQIGAQAYVSVNIGSGTPQEAAEWLEYLTTAQLTTLAKERAINGHPAPYKVAFLGIGNESWDCGGNMTPDYYLSQLKIYSRFVRNYNPEQQKDQHMLKIAVGPGGGEPRWTEWTEAIMKAYQHHRWSCSRRRDLHTRRRHYAARGRHRGEGLRWQIVAGHHQYRSPSTSRGRGQPGWRWGEIGYGRNANRSKGGQRQHSRRT